MLPKILTSKLADIFETIYLPKLTKSKYNPLRGNTNADDSSTHKIVFREATGILHCDGLVDMSTYYYQGSPWSSQGKESAHSY